MASLGSRIRALRKQQGKTLADLAGERLTKGMLSLIENDKAQPSLESLQYIAEALDLERSELLEEVSVRQLRDMYDKAKQAYDQEEYIEVNHIIEPILTKKIPLSYEKAQLKELYSLSLYKQKKSDWEAYMSEAEDHFLQLHQLNQGFRVALDQISCKMALYQFDEAIVLLDEKKQFYKSQSFEMELMNELQSYYLEIGLLFLTEQIPAGLKLLKETIEFSTKRQLFYKMDEYYRMAIVFSSPEEDRDVIKHYVKKHGQLTQLLDSNGLYYLDYFLRGLVLRRLDEDSESALIEFQQGLKLIKVGISPYFYHLEMGACYYDLKQYEQALEILPDHDSFLDEFHGLDISFIYSADAYIARSHYALNDQEKAIFYATRAKDRLEQLQYPDKKTKTFVLDTYSMICDT